MNEKRKIPDGFNSFNDIDLPIRELPKVCENQNGITIRELKSFIEKCENLDGEVWLEEYESGLTNVAKYIWPLNGGEDILFCSNDNETRIDIKPILINTLQDFAEYDCAYGDGCPENPEFIVVRHGTCIGCKARKALRQCGIEIRKW